MHRTIKKAILVTPFLFLCLFINAQKIQLNAGPEVLRSFNNDQTFIGIGGTVQAVRWIKERLTLGVNTGYYHFTSTKTLVGSNTKPSYNMVPVMLVIHYPLPIIPKLWGEDHMGYAFTQDVALEKTNEKVGGGFSYYFALGYTIGSRLDASIKIGRTRLDKKNNPSNVNEHNFGIKLAYIF